MNEVKEKAIQEAFKQIEKQYGKGSIMKMGEKVYDQLDVVSSGSLKLDMAMGVGDILAVELLKYMDQKAVVKQRLLFMQLLKHKKLADMQHLLMLNMHLILGMQKL